MRRIIAIEYGRPAEFLTQSSPVRIRHLPGARSVIRPGERRLAISSGRPSVAILPYRLGSRCMVNSPGAINLLSNGAVGRFTTPDLFLKGETGVTHEPYRASPLAVAAWRWEKRPALPETYPRRTRSAQDSSDAYLAFTGRTKSYAAGDPDGWKHAPFNGSRGKFGSNGLKPHTGLQARREFFPPPHRPVAPRGACKRRRRYKL